MAPTHMFDQDEVTAYFDRLKLPSHLRYYTLRGLSATRQLDVLTLLHAQHLRTIPFENLGLHYSRHRLVDVHLPKIFDKIVRPSGRGGYCMETNFLFNALLRSLGYDAYLVPSRVFDQSKGRYLALTHCLNIVVIDGERYAVDVGFGGNVATVPLRLTPGEVQPLAQPMQARLRHDMISEGLSRRTKYWIYEYRPNTQAGWSIQYCFLDLELLPEDLVVMNLGPSTSRTSFFTQKVVCLKFTGERDFIVKYGTEKEAPRQNGVNGSECSKPDLVDGVVILDGAVLKWRKGGMKQWEVTLKSEEERIQALESIFGIHLLLEEREAILGTVSALPVQLALK